MPEQPVKIKDLIELPAIKTVVQLSDVQDRDTRHMLLENFIVTEEVGKNLEAILKSIAEQKGQGVFIEGNFGSGKSHFLTVLAAAFENPDYWQLLTAQQKQLAAHVKKIISEKYSIFKISLVEHAGAEVLEEIVSRAAVETGLIKKDDLKLARKDRFSLIFSNLAFQQNAGVVLLIDELSEYLRSKPDARRFNEEIRFLQYLGELSFHNPLWIIATLQEKIEDTGEITQETFNKIKDRYPVRLFLGTHHVEELISKRLVKRRSGAEAERKLGELFRQFKQAFESFPASEEKFKQIYPVHPATIELLDNLKVLFSQHRGVVDFIHYQIQGDTRRNIDGILDQPAEHLLTPEYIFDHFQVRIKDTMELNPYLEVAYRYFEKNIPRIFSDKNQQQTALRLVKTLILAAISPLHTELNIRQLGDMLLYRITDLDPQINYQFIADLLGKLYQEGAYLAHQKKDNFLQDIYRIDLEANVNAIVQRKIESILSDLQEEDRRIYHHVLKDFSEPFLPLNGFLEQPVAQEEFLWQQTSRTGTRMFGDLEAISNQQLRQVAATVHRGNQDFLIIVASPEKASLQKKHYTDEVKPLLADLNLLDYTILWLPNPLENTERLKEFYALNMLLDRYRDDHSHTGRRVFEFLRMRVQEEQRNVKELLVNAYLDGELLVGDYPEKFEQLGLMPFNKLMESMADRLFTRRFPKHLDIAPYSAIYSPGRVNDAIQKFFRAGSIPQDQADSSLRATLENYLKPLGLLARSGGNLVLRVDLRHSPLVQFVMEFLEDEPVESEYLYVRAHQSPYGISRAQFNFLLLALIFSGNAIPYGQNRKIALDKITAYNLENIQTLSKGDVLDERTILALRDVPFIDQKFKQQKFSTQLQEQIFQQVKERIQQIQELLGFGSRQIEEIRHQPYFDQLPIERMEQVIKSIDHTIRKIQLGRNSREGLQNLASGLETAPLFHEEYDQFRKLVRFFREYKNAYSQIQHYLQHPDLIIPEEETYGTLYAMREEITQLTKQQELVFSDELARLMELFRDFQKEYVARYLLEHQQQKGREAHRWIDQVRNSRSYLALRRLSTLRSINVEPNAAQVESRLGEAESAICDQLSADLLRIQPDCVCGFHLGDKAAKREGLSQTSRTIQEGITAYFQRLKAEDVRKRLEEFRATVKKINQKDKLKVIDEFLGLKDQSEFSAWVEPGNLKVLKEALESRVNIHEMTPDELIGQFLNRTVEVGKFRTHILNVLNRLEQNSKETFVRIIEKKEAPLRALSRQIAGKSPFVFNLYPNWEETEWQKLLTAALWLKQHRLPMKKITQLLNFKIDRENEEDFFRELAVLLQEIPREEIGEIDEQTLVDWFDTLYQESELEQLSEFVSREEQFFPLLRYSLEKGIKIAMHRQPAPGKPDTRIIFREPENVYHRCAHHLLEVIPQFFSLKKQLGRQNTGDLSEKKAAWWNQLYLKGLFATPYLIHLITRYLKLFDLQSFMYDLLRETTEGILQFSENFQAVIPVLSAEIADNKQPPLSITRLLPEVMGDIKQSALSLVLIDGLRWDLYEMVKLHFLEKLFPDLKIVKELPVWSVLPSNTETVMEKLVNSLGEMNFKKTAREPSASYPSRLSEDVELVPGLHLHKINVVDTKIHTSREDLVVFGNEILLQVKADLERYFQKLERGTRILVFTDHGFVENPAFTETRKYDQPRYRHGGGSPFELIVPALLLQKSADIKF